MNIRESLFSVLSLLLVLTGCDYRNMEHDAPYDSYSSVTILYTPAYNNLSSKIRRNVEIICENPLPMKSSDKAILLVTHSSVSDSDFDTPTEPMIIRISSDWSGSAVMDTLKRLNPKEQLLDKDVMRSCLTYIHDNFKSDHYGIVFSSHGTGWLPEDYYRAPVTKSLSGPELKSFGATYEGTPSHIKASHEIIVQDMAKAIPMHMDYIIFDACLMGGIEVAYELREVADIIGFSQAEILATGFDYSTFTSSLLVHNSPQEFCENYFRYYDSLSGSSRSATVSVIDCSKLQDLAAVCTKMFERYRTGIASVKAENVQGFFTSGKHWFYDLQDILVNAGISSSDLSSLSSAINECVLYKAHTEKILNSVPIRSFCGFSSYLPCNGSRYLDSFYKDLAWNKVTGLVE